MNNLAKTFAVAVLILCGAAKGAANAVWTTKEAALKMVAQK